MILCRPEALLKCAFRRALLHDVFYRHSPDDVKVAVEEGQDEDAISGADAATSEAVASGVIARPTHRRLFDRLSSPVRGPISHSGPQGFEISWASTSA